MDDNIIRRLHFACRITKAVDTPSEYEVLLVSTANMVARTRLNDTFIRTLSLLLTKCSFEKYRQSVWRFVT